MEFSLHCRCGKLWGDTSQVHYEFIVPLYKAENLIDGLLKYIDNLIDLIPCQPGIVFVIDGDFDKTRERLSQSLTKVDFSWKILTLSRNFGVGPALMAGFESSSACFISAFGADLQEPETVFVEFLKILSDANKHIALGARKSRKDPFFAKKASQVYWRLFTKFISPDLPKGGFDVCALSSSARIALCSMNEKNTNITAQIDWLGYEREFVYFDRLPRVVGKSSWKISRKFKLFFDSFYGFTDIPINVLLAISSLGIFLGTTFGTLVTISWLLGYVSVPGYASIIFLQIFSTNLILFVIALASGYSTRTFENSKMRPKFIIQSYQNSEAKNI